METYYLFHNIFQRCKVLPQAWFARTKRDLLYSMKAIVYELPHELTNDLHNVEYLPSKNGLLV